MSSGSPISIFISDIVYGVNLEKNISVVNNDDVSWFKDFDPHRLLKWHLLILSYLFIWTNIWIGTFDHLNWFFTIWIFQVSVLYSWNTTLSSVSEFVNVNLKFHLKWYWYFDMFNFETNWVHCYRKLTYSKWYFLSFSWLTCTIWFEVMTFKSSEVGRDFCCLGFRFNGLNLFEDFRFWWKEGINVWLELIDFSASEFVLFLPFRVRLPLIDLVCFFSLLCVPSSKSLPWSAFLLVLRSLKKLVN